MLLWARGREEASSKSLCRASKGTRKAKTADLYQRHMQRKRKEVHNSGGVSCAKSEYVYEGEKKESSLLIE